MDVDSLWFPAYFTVAMFVAATNSKALGVAIAFSLGLLCVYPNRDAAFVLVIMLIPATIIASFRD